MHEADGAGDRVIGLAAAVVVHAAAFLLMDVDVADETRRAPTTVEFEVAELPAPPLPTPAPAEPESTEDPAAAPTPGAPPAKAKTAVRPQPKAPASSTATSEPTKPLRFDLSQTTPQGSSEVVVSTGVPSRPSGSQRGAPGPAPARPDGSGTGSAPQGGGAGRGQGAWSPTPSHSVDRLPVAIDVPKIECAAVRDAVVAGTVVLRVQILASGKVRGVRVKRGIGGGCDEVAARALRRARFRPARATSGEPADYEIEYEYVFKRS